MKNKLNPSLRSKKRYLLIEGSRKDVEESILEYIGVLGWARAAPIVVSDESGNVVLGIERGELANVRAAFEASKRNVKVKKVSGTIKGLD